MQKQLSPEEQGKIIAVLTNMGAVQECPRCGNDSFVLLEQVFDLPEKFRPIGAPSEVKIPSVIVVCDKCGFISQHALFVLESLIKEQQIQIDNQ